ncbi:MAG: chloride channel protein [Hyphomicrobiaceae bacterium]
MGASSHKSFANLRWAETVARLERKRLSKFTRDNGTFLIVLSALVGGLTGMISASLVTAAEFMHTVLYDLDPRTNLSAAVEIPLVRALVVLLAGGLIMGVVSRFSPGLRHEIVDPIEANALRGGRMSIRDSLFVVLEAFLSSSAGLSLGLEGGYTQISGAIGSWFGRIIKRRRIDVRMLVGAGVAGCIAGAYDAPFAGATYAFELIVGSYTVATLAPVVAAAVAGTFAARQFVDHTYRIPHEAWNLGDNTSIFGALLLGVFCGLMSIALMRGVTTTEHIARRSGLPRPWRPLAGAFAVWCMLLVTPHILSSGHGAMTLVLQAGWPVGSLLLVLVFKILASAVSLGSGFRGGLFSTSLFLGTLSGALVGTIGAHLGWLPESAIGVMSLVGMASFASGVLGCPIAMALLAVEITNDLTVVSPVLLGVIGATLTVRQYFGYSFATWRFHLRGEAILGGEDVGWAREMTAGKLMRQDMTLLPADMPVDVFCAQPVPINHKYVIATNEDGAFAGFVDVAAVFAAHQTHSGKPSDREDLRLTSFLVNTEAWVVPDLPADRLLLTFDALQAELVAVVESETNRQVVGVVTEAFALKRYRQELEARHNEIFGS